MFQRNFIAMALALALSACHLAPAFAQANSSSTWTTPGNETVGGTVLMCINGTSQAVPCSNLTAASNSALEVVLQSSYPAFAVAETSSATGSTSAVTATLAASSTLRTYLCGFTATGNEAATGAVVAVTVAGTVTGSLNFNISHPVTPTLGVLTETFTPCVPSSAINTTITVTSAADAAGTNVAVSAWGYVGP